MGETQSGKFHALDYIVIAITLLVSVSIGVYFWFTGGKQKIIQEYFLGSRNQKVIPIAFSLMASFMSAVTLHGMSAETYSYGTILLIINFSNIIFTPVAAYLYLPVFFKLREMSVYEYLHRRFGIRVRITASLTYILYITIYMGIVLYVPALGLEVLTGLSPDMSILIVGFVCMFYSTVGGIKAIIITDIFQSLMVFVAVFIVIFGAVYDKGSFSAIWQIAKERERIQFFNIDPDPTVRYTYWNLLFGGGLTYLSIFAINQTQVQRYLTMKDYNAAVKSLWLSLLIMLILSFSVGFSGLAIFSRYYDCDPLLAGRISRSDQMMPLFIMESVGHFPGLGGLFVAGIFSATLSTVAACLNSLAAVTLEDYIKPLYMRSYKNTIPDSQSVLLSKLLTLSFGFMCLGNAFLAHFLGGLLQTAMTIFSIVGGPLLGVFTLGIFIPLANETGALVGILSGLTFSFWVGFGEPKSPTYKLPLTTTGCYSNLTTTTTTTMATLTSTAATVTDTQYVYLFRISYMYYVTLGFIVTIVAGVVISWITSSCDNDQDQCHPDLFSPPVAKYLRRNRDKTNIELIDEIKSSEKY